VELTGKLIGALLITYFVSRVLLRLPNPLRKAAGLTLVHGLSLALIVGALVVLRGTAQASATEQLKLYVAPQVLWWLLDLLREHRVRPNFIAARSRH
jgi:hypothetical protein